MLTTIAIALAVLAFIGAGTFNMVGTAKTRADFVRWGYPAWWFRIAGVLELGTALLIAMEATRAIGIALGGIIIAAALITVVRARDFFHLVPLGLFAALLVVVSASGLSR